MAGMVNPAAQGLIQTLSAQQTLLMKMRILSLGKNYDVMDTNERVLCQVGLDAGQNVTGQMLGAAVSQIGGDYIGRWAQRSLEYTYTVKTPDGQLALEIRKGSGGNRADFSVVDPASNTLVGTIQLKRSLLGGLTAQWVAPDGPVYLSTKGNILRRQYEILDGTGRPMGHVRHKILAIRDTWNLELSPGVNHLYSALFATVLDFEKKM